MRTQRQIWADSDAKMCEWFGLTQDQVYALKFEYGSKFLREWIGEEFEEDITMMEYTPEFWAWWQQVWHIVDVKTIKFVGQTNALLLKMRGKGWETYCAWHDTKHVSMRPNSAIMGSYHAMIKEMANKNQVIVNTKQCKNEKSQS